MLDPTKIPNDAITIFKAIVGSRAFGTNVEGSDSDMKGIYVQHPDDVLGFNYQPHAIIGKDETFYEIRRFIELLSDGNPTCIELLFSPEDCILINEPAFKILRDNKELFITKKCISTFGNYAMEQFSKAEIHNRHRRNKNLLHCRRLLDMSLEIAQTGQINIRRPNREFLLSIKDGLTTFEEVQKSSQEDFVKIKELSKKSLLRDRVDEEVCNELLIKIRHCDNFWRKVAVSK